MFAFAGDFGDGVFRAGRLVAVREFRADRMGRAAPDAGAAAGAPGERVVAVGTLVRRQLECGHDRTEPHGRAVFGDQAGRQPEGAGPGHEGDVPLGPARCEILHIPARRRINLLLFEVRSDGGESLPGQQPGELRAHLLIQDFAEAADGGPFDGRMNLLGCVGLARFAVDRQHPDDDRFRLRIGEFAFQHFIGRPMERADDLFEFEEERIVRRGDSDVRLFEEAVRSGLAVQVVHHFFDIGACQHNLISCSLAALKKEPRRTGALFTFLRFDSLFEVVAQLGHVHAVLQHRVAVADGHAVVVGRLEIVGDAVRRADLVLAAVTLADAAGFVVFGAEVAVDVLVEIVRLLLELLRLRQDGDLDRRDERRQVQHDAGILLHPLLRGRGLLFVVGGGEQREHRAVEPDRGFNDGRHELAAVVVIHVREILAGEFAVARQVPGTAVVDALELSPAERELHFDVDRGLRVVGELLVLVDAEEVILEFQLVLIIADPLRLPVLEELHALLAVAEEFHLHLREFAAAEREVARVDLVAERLADLRDAERQLLPGRHPDAVEVDENRLAGLGAQVGGMFLVEHGADEGFHHQIEFTRFGQVLRAAVRAGGRVLHLVDAVAGLALAAVGHEVAELIEMAGGFPDPRMADDRRIESFDVVAGLDHFVPPEVFDGALHPGAVGAVIPESVDTAVDLRARKHESATFAQTDDLIHQLQILHTLFGHFFFLSVV